MDDAVKRNRELGDLKIKDLLILIGIKKDFMYCMIIMTMCLVILHVLCRFFLGGFFEKPHITQVCQLPYSPDLGP